MRYAHSTIRQAHAFYAEAEIERLTAEAYRGVEQLPLREEGRELLLSLFHTLSGRTK